MITKTKATASAQLAAFIDQLTADRRVVSCEFYDSAGALLGTSKPDSAGRFKGPPSVRQARHGW
jgi:uncharacterized membrane protein affecting hemolysin expression